MTDEAYLENVACENVVKEFKAFLAQHHTPAPILKLCDELAGRIMLRRFFTKSYVDPATAENGQREGR